MGRSRRVDPENGWHHVMNRGAARQAIFLDARDARTFQDLLGASGDGHGIEVHAYCLMRNHFHLLVRCPDAGLSAFMHDLTARYVRHVNDRKGTDGPLFRGRFRSLTVDSESYLAAVGRYIHRNPKDLPGEVDLVTYRWSSLQYYAGRRPLPAWLSISELATGHRSSSDYVDFVEGAAKTIGSVRWAVATALAECDDQLVEGAQVSRSVAAAMLDLAPPDVQAAIDQWLQFPTANARAAARSRARRRVADDAVLAAIVGRALELCSADLAQPTITNGAWHHS